MKISEIRIQNYKSIIDTGIVKVQPIFGFVGENNVGKSNILFAINSFLSGGSGGIKEENYNDIENPIIIWLKFDSLTDFEKRQWKKYLINGELILEKQIFAELNNKKYKLTAEYHGYEAEPTNWFCSVKKIIEREGQRPNWVRIVEENGLPDYFISEGKCNKKQFTKSMERYLLENDIEYNEPDLSTTQALGLQSNVISLLPDFYLLPAITDYSNEIDKRQKNTTFRRLMAALAERIMINDPAYHKINEAINSITSLLNETDGAENEIHRLESLGVIEENISKTLGMLMPTYSKVKMLVEVEEISELFANGVSLNVDDGVDTAVLDKGHGLQRAIVFSLLKTLIDTERSRPEIGDKSIIIAIEEPELYLHPQMSKLFFDTITDFSNSDQVIYTTHSTSFINAYNYFNIAIVNKINEETGTKVITVPGDIFSEIPDKKVFKGLSRFNPSINEIFFSKKILVVEGPEDLIAINHTLQVLDRIKKRPEELGWTILVAGGKEAIPFFMIVMNAFKMNYTVLHDLDITEEMPQQSRETHEKTNRTISNLAGDNKVITFPIKLEETIGLDSHLKDQYKAEQYFQIEENINDDLQEIVISIFD